MTEAAVVKTFGYRHEAEFAQATLREAGIESILSGDDAGAMFAGMSFTRRFRLVVRAEDLDRARDLLGDVDEADDADGDEPADPGSP